MAQESDGKGNILIHKFTVTYKLFWEVISEVSAKFDSYEEGYRWARQKKFSIENEDPDIIGDSAYTIDIAVESKWVPEAEW